jgi:hypothetical protein
VGQNRGDHMRRSIEGRGVAVLATVVVWMASTTGRAAMCSMPQQSRALNATHAAPTVARHVGSKTCGTASVVPQTYIKRSPCFNRVATQPYCRPRVCTFNGSSYVYPSAYSVYGYAGYGYASYGYAAYGGSYPTTYASSSVGDPSPTYSRASNGRGVYELGHDWGQDLRREVVTWDEFAAYLKERIPQMSDNDRTDFNRGFAAGYGSNAQAAFGKAMKEAGLQPQEPPAPPGPKVITFPLTQSGKS